MRLFLSAFAPPLSGGGPLWPPLASLLLYLHLVAVVLVLDMWSVLGVAPFVSPRRVGVVVN